MTEQEQFIWNAVMPNVQDNILSWCRSNSHKYFHPVMRQREGVCKVQDNNMFEPKVIAEGASWEEVTIKLNIPIPNGIEE